MNKRGAVQKAGDFIWFIREAVEPFIVGGALLSAVLGDEIGEAGAGDGGFEAGGLRDRPFGHVAAVGPTADGQFFGIRDAFCDEVVDAGHHVPVIAATPVAAIRFDEFLAVTTGAADIGIENRVAPRCKKLAPGFDGVLPSTGGAAVDEGDERKLRFAVVTGRFEKRRFDLHAIDKATIPAESSRFALQKQPRLNRKDRKHLDWPVPRGDLPTRLRL